MPMRVMRVKPKIIEPDLPGDDCCVSFAQMQAVEREIRRQVYAGDYVIMRPEAAKQRRYRLVDIDLVVKTGFLQGVGNCAKGLYRWFGFDGRGRPRFCTFRKVGDQRWLFVEMTPPITNPWRQLETRKVEVS